MVRGGSGRAAASLQQTEVITGRAERQGALLAQIYSPGVRRGDPGPAVRPDRGPDARRRELSRRGEGGVRGKPYYLNPGCGALKEAAAFPFRNGRGGGGGGGKCGAGGGGPAWEASRGAPGVWPQSQRARGGKPSGITRGEGEAGLLRWALALDLCIRQAATPSVPPGTQAWNRAVTPRGSQGGRGHPRPVGARRLRRHKWSLMIQRGSARQKRAPGSPNPLVLFL